MDANDLTRLLESYRLGELSTEDIVSRLQQAPFERAGDFATVDLHRRLRCGFSEVTFGQGKTPEQIASTLRALLRNGEGGLVTRVAAEVAGHLRREFPEGEYNELGRTFRVRFAGESSGPPLGKVVVITAGTSDLPVA